MLRIAICDDDMQELTRISELMNLYQAKKTVPLRYDVFNSAFELLEAMRWQSYQVIFLDIMMPGVTGIQAAHEIRSFDEETDIIFLTSSPEFAVESYAVNAFYYVLKPASAEKLYSILDRLFVKVQQTEDFLLLTLTEGIVRLPFSRIEFLEVTNKKLMFHLSDGSIRELSGSLSEFEALLLAREEFIKVHRSFLVNMEQIDSLGINELTTTNHHLVPVSRLLYPQVRERYMKFLFVEKGVR